MTTTQSAAPSRKALIFILVTVVLNAMGLTLIIPIAPFLVSRYVSDPNAIGIAVASLTSIYAVCQFAVAPGLGLLSDRYGRRPVLLVCLLGSAVGYLLLGFGGALWVLFLGRAIDGLTGANNAVINAYLADIIPTDQRGKYFGLVGALASVSVVVGPAVGGIIAQFGYEVPFYLAAVVGFANLLIGLFFMPESLPQERRITQINVARLNPFTGLRDVLGMPQLRWLLLGMFFYTLSLLTISVNISLYVKDTLNWGTAEVGTAFSVFGIFSVAVQAVALPWLLKRIGTVWVARIGIVITIICLLLVALVAVDPSAILLYAALCVLAVGEGLVSPTLLELIARGADARSQGKVMGGNQSAQSLANIGGPLIFGVIYDQIGHAAPYLIAAFGVLLVLALLSAALPALDRYTASVEAASLETATPAS
ncbi:MAG TPA: MFS transporter [Phototrophicaceae bacterium]|nr:MFS transporter [Phototrophicaceae bacterium]